MKDKKIISLLLIIIGISLYFMPNYVVEAETYNGEYSIDYLLRNYSIVTLGQKERKMNFDGYSNLKKGDFLFTSFNDANIEGALLINGDFKSG